MIRPMKTPICFAYLAFCAGISAAAERPDLVIADFESATYGTWTVAGDAFGPGPATGALPGQMPVSGFQGERLVNSFYQGDKTTGSLTSPTFQIDRRYINFLVGGGNHPNQTAMNLLVDGKTVRTVTGPDSEFLRWDSWDVSLWQGQTARLQIVDEHTGGWGHINVDQIMQSDEPPKVIDDREAALAQATQSIKRATERAANDPTRPLYHLTSPANWINDPNGPLYFKGYYHLFYQHNPYGDQWGHMHWGHWRSQDLVKWEHQPVALWPSLTKGEEHCFSGCTTLNGKDEPMIFYTSIGSREPQCWIALPEDDALITWKKYAANPVLSQNSPEMKYYDFRDPFVFKHEGRTYMVHGGNLNQGKGGQGCVSLYEAQNTDLTQWRYKSILFTDTNAANIECPNFFQLGDQFVLITSPHRRCDYFVGSFDPQAGKFTPHQRGLVDQGEAFYAPNTLTEAQGRHLLWGWVRGFKGGRGWNGCMTLPRVLSLQEGKLIQQPAPELAALRGNKIHKDATRLNGEQFSLDLPPGDSVEIVLEFTLEDAQSVGLQMRRSADSKGAVKIEYDRTTLTVAGMKVPLPLDARRPQLKLHVFLDKSVLEVYANDGRVCVTRVVYPEEQGQGLEVFANGGAASMATLDLWPLRSIW
jgi:sucrose-6-phosphate hydrolase SacC (GH32 family)